MRIIIVTLCLIVGLPAVYGQNGNQVKGLLQDSTGQSVIAASVKLKTISDSLVTTSDLNGNFEFKNVNAKSFSLTISSLGYETKTFSFQFDDEKQLDLGTLLINESSQLLREVAVDGTPMITVKEDTLEYRTKDYQLRDGAVTEDLLKKLDGVEVDKDGNVTAQGESVARVRINGKDFFGGDVKTATKNLPADIIEKIQIIDDYGDQANLTGNRTGDPERVLNIEIAPEKNRGDFGNFRVGGGTEERYQLTGMYSSFADSRQFSTLGNLNNTNADLFDFNTQGGGARRMRGGRFGGGFGGNQNGLTTTGSIGLNYRNSFWDEKLTTYGSYSYSHNDNSTLSSSFNQNTYPDSLIITNQGNTDEATIGNNHRFDWNVEYQLDDNNFFKLSPSFSLSTSNGTSLQNSQFSQNEQLENFVNRNNVNHNSSPNVGVSGLFNHRFNDKGRNLFVNFSINNASTESDRDEITETYLFGMNASQDSIYQRQLIDLQNKRLNGGTSISYIEPLGENSNIELEYRYDFSNYDNDRIANTMNPDGETEYNPELSNIYDYKFITNNINLNYRFRTDKLNYSIGASVQPSSLKGNTVINNESLSFSRNSTHFAPIARFEYRFSRTKRLSFNYSGRPNEPSYSQLQPVTDISNPQFPVTGNPDLAAEFSHNLYFRYNNFDYASGNSLFVMLNGTMTNDKVVSNRVQSIDEVHGVVQSTTYLNTDGYYSLRGFYNYSKPFLDRKYVVSLNGSANFNNNISFTNSEKNMAQNWVLSQGLNMQINPKEWLEVTPGVRYSFNTTQNSIDNRSNLNIHTWSMEMDSKVYFTPTFLWGLTLNKMSNSGYTSDVDANPFIINTYLEKQFLKGNKGALRLQGYDLLDEQVNISRTVTENTINDRRSNRLARYFMLTLSYRFDKFAGGTGGREQGERRGPGMPGRFGPPGPR